MSPELPTPDIEINTEETGKPGTQPQRKPDDQEVQTGTTEIKRAVNDVGGWGEDSRAFGSGFVN